MTVGDYQGLSYYSDRSVQKLLNMDQETLETARINFETFQKIKLYHSQPGLTAPQIARQLTLDDLLFQIFSNRYARGSMIITTNRAFKDWSEIFNNNSILTSAILDRLPHHT